MKSIISPVKLTVALSILLIINLNSSYAVNAGPEISVVTDKEPGVAVLHALTKLTDALKSKNISFENVKSINEAKGKLVIVTGLASGDGTAVKMLKDGNRTVPQVPEALTIWKTHRQKKQVWIISGFDDRGLMYGLLDVADRIGWSKNRKSPMSEVKEITEQPDVSERAVSLYVLNRAYWETRFYDETYWARYLDLLAQNRFNTFVIILGYNYDGFLSPSFPYFFDVEEFPVVRMVGLSPQEQHRNLEALNKIIRMTHDRGIRITIGFWDYIYRGSARGKSIPGRANDVPVQPVPGLIWGVTSENLADYNKTALAKFVKLVPDIDAIQFRMHWESGLRREEMTGFWSSVFKQMKETAPNLRLDLRAKELPDSVIQSAIDIGVNFRIDTKYWMEQMGMPWHPSQVNPETEYRRHSYGDMLRYPVKYKMHWRLWNGGTSRVLLWGDPEYTRRFVESTHLYDGDGFEVNEPLGGKMLAQPKGSKPFDILNPQYKYYDYEFERYWHFFQVFGRIGYNPETPPDVWQKEFELRFGKNAAPFVENALHQASWILPRIVASCYPYSYFPMSRGWAEKQRLGDLPTYALAAGSDLRQFANFDEEAQILIEKGATAKVLPSMTSLWFEQTSSDLNGLITKAEKVIGNNRNKEFNSTITDIKIMSSLALYHSRRIPAAVSYRLFERTKDVSLLDDAIVYERNAIEAWRKIVNAAGDYYTNDLKMGSPGNDLCGHWKDELELLEKGLSNLELKRKDFKAEGEVKTAPHYKVAKNVTNEKLFQISLLPVTSAPAGKPLTVSVKVNANAGVRWVHLLYRSVNQEQEYQTTPMPLSNEKDTYTTIVPAEQINPEWDFMYLIEVMDKNGNGKIYPDLNKETPYKIVKLGR